MAIFAPRANLFMIVALLAAAGGVAVLLILIWLVPVMGYNSRERYTPPQPVPFSHQHHVSGLGLGCALPRGAEMVASGVIAHLMPRASQPRATTSPAALVPGWRRTLMLPSASLSPEHPG